MSPRSILGEEWRARAEAWLPGVIAREPEITSADKAYYYMREHGLYVPRSYVREVWRELVRAETYRPLFDRLPEGEYIPERFYRETSFRTKAKYTHVVKIEGYNRNTGEPITRYAAVISDDRLTVGEILDDAFDYANEYQFSLAPGTIHVGIEAAIVRR